MNVAHGAELVGMEYLMNDITLKDQKVWKGVEQRGARKARMRNELHALSRQGTIMTLKSSVDELDLQRRSLNHSDWDRFEPHRQNHPQETPRAGKQKRSQQSAVLSSFNQFSPPFHS